MTRGHTHGACMSLGNHFKLTSQPVNGDTKMSKPVVYVARTIPSCGLTLLSESCTLRVHQGDLPPTRQELIDGVQGVDGIISLLSDRLDNEVFDAAGTQLKVVANYAVGFNNIDVQEATRRSIAVGNTPDVLTDATADMAVALTLAAARQLRGGSDAVRNGDWKTWEPLGWLGVELQGKTLGIIGMGRIGAAVARRLSGGWGMKIVYTSRSRKPDFEADLAATYMPLDELLSVSDVVSVHAPLTDETAGFIGEKEFQRMKRSAVFVNTARGEVVDQAALIAALRARTIFAAGLDVCTPEPLPTDSDLLEQDNCILVPHIGSATVEARNAMSMRAGENILAGLAGNPLPFPVN